MSETTGADDAIALMEQFEQKTGRFIFDVEILSIATDGDTVLTERIDYIRSPEGELLLTVSIMGAFRIRDGKVVSWRDYFDTTALAAYGGGRMTKGRDIVPPAAACRCQRSAAILFLQHSTIDRNVRARDIGGTVGA